MKTAINETMQAGSTCSNLSIRSFVVQSYNNFLESSLSRPGMEEEMKQETVLNHEHQLWDIKDGIGIIEITGSDNKPFTHLGLCTSNNGGGKGKSSSQDC